MSLTYDEIAEIIKLIDSSSCDELVIETGDMKLVVRRNGTLAAAAAEYTERGSASIKVAPVSARDTPVAAPKLEAAAGQVEVTAPMVGTFYRAPNPEAPPFVEVGSVVRAGDPLCLIEVMKLFTTINSEVSGRIIQIGAENAELVEYGRALFVIEPV